MENEIVKDLESVCKWCEKHGRGTTTAFIEIAQNAIDVKNRQKAEIDNLLKEMETRNDKQQI